jgi:hypothetical protein
MSSVIKITFVYVHVIERKSQAGTAAAVRFKEIVGVGAELYVISRRVRRVRRKEMKAQILGGEKERGTEGRTRTWDRERRSVSIGTDRIVLDAQAKT